MNETAEPTGGTPLSSRQRRELFLSMAGKPNGTTVLEVYSHAQALGDSATEEAFYNIARRLAHSSQVTSSTDLGGRTRYTRAAELWLEEDELADMVDADYPVVALAIWRESVQQVNDVPETVWVELRERLFGENARQLFFDAIVSYCDDFDAQLQLILLSEKQHASDLPRILREADSGYQLLLRLTKYGLGLSREAVLLPASVEVGLGELRRGNAAVRVDPILLRQELERRVEEGAFLKLCPLPSEDLTQRKEILVGGVDGSTRGGLLSVSGQDGDFHVAHAPLVSINTAVGQVNRKLRVGQRMQAAFTRLPERPEDMQRQDNRHTVMAKLLHPDLTDAQYMHAVWNAMDLVETKMTLRLLRRWYLDSNHMVEVPPADLVLRDGSASPQARDFTHYKQQDSYGQIVRDLIETNWEVALNCRENGRTVCGVVKQTQLAVFSPVLNWYACKTSGKKDSQLGAWPLHSMNIASDQLLLTRLLTAGRRIGDDWVRTGAVVRPFHALTNFGRDYSREITPAAKILREYLWATDQEDLAQNDRAFWASFQGDRDSFVRMLEAVQYSSVFLAAVPRLDNDNVLPRLEMLVTAPTAENEADPWIQVDAGIAQTINGLRAVGFDVASEHNAFRTQKKLDIMPRILITTHDIVKTWALELVGRVQEYIGYHLARYVKSKRVRGVQVRPFSRAELEALYHQLRNERERQAGSEKLLGE